jgi:serine/threonine protein kinase
MVPAEAQLTKTMTAPPWGGSLRRARERFVSSSPNSSQRLETDVAQEGARRIGTPAFMAPEQARGEADIDAREDIYSLGCVAYYLLTGALVFHASSAISMALAPIEQKPEPPSQRAELLIPSSLERVVLSCLEKKRKDRPQTAPELDALLASRADLPERTQADARRWWLVHRPRAQLRDCNMSTASQPPHGARIRMAMTVSGRIMAHQVGGKHYTGPTRHLLLPLLEVDAQKRRRSRAAGGELANLLATRARVNETLKLDPHPMESRR